MAKERSELGKFTHNLTFSQSAVDSVFVQSSFVFLHSIRDSHQRWLQLHVIIVINTKDELCAPTAEVYDEDTQVSHSFLKIWVLSSIRPSALIL